MAGRPAAACDIVNAIRCLTHNGPVRRALPANFPPAGTVYWRADKWQAGGCTEQMHDDLRGRIRLAAGRKAAPTAAVIDSQSVKGSEMIARTRRGYDAGKKINGTKRHLAVDTIGLLLTVLVTAASVQDRDAAKREPRQAAAFRASCCYLDGHAPLRRLPPQRSSTLAGASAGREGRGKDSGSLYTSWRVQQSTITENPPDKLDFLLLSMGAASRLAGGSDLGDPAPRLLPRDNEAARFLLLSAVPEPV